ncbi:MAG: HDIG domain-containing protein [Clostridia bacterium]|nr:HDIG domain-containing protein [Clostridia bacterium]
MTLRQRILCVFMIVLTFAALVGTVIASGLSTQYDISVGSVCPEDIYATRTITDTVTTQSRKAAAAAGIADAYVTDFGAVDSAVDRVTKVLTIIRSEREEPTEESTAPIENTVIENLTYLSLRAYTAALEISDADFDFIAENTPVLLSTIMTEGITDKNEGVAAFEKAFSALGNTNSSVLLIAKELCQGAISVNKTYSAEETLRQKEEASNAISNVTYMKNQVIARRGEIITEAQLAMLKELGFVKGAIQIDVFHTISVISLLLLAMGLAILYYMTLGKKEVSATACIVTIICSILTIAGSFIILFGIKNSENIIHILPLSLIPALVALLLGSNLSVVVNVIISVLAGIQTNDFSVALALILAGSATAYIFSGVRRRTHLLSATALSSLAYAITYSSIVIDTSKSIVEVLAVFAYAFLGGFFGGILTIGTIPFWEAIFDVITPMKLGELSNPEHKLLKKMLMKAPGSYHHSLTVANMADAAATAIGANALLARVGAYYHDIGKMENPMYFKENQFGTDNPHDLLPYEESAQILLKHVTDGVRLASQHHLPTAVKDIIAQHHGTTTTSYFLYKAKSENPDVDASLFTYEGPVPQSKEATIIMLADACEAAVRAMREKGDVDAQKVVDNIVSGRIAEGQLSGTNLTFSDLEKVKEAFVTTLDQYFHKRILYPQNEKKD